MLIQGSNTPLVLVFDSDISDVADMVITLWQRKSVELKRWTAENIYIDGDTAICPISEEETAALPEGYITLETKGWDQDGNTIIWEKVPILVEYRSDRGINLTGG